MLIDFISHNESGFYSNLMLDYLNEVDELKSLYNNYPTIENFKTQIQQKKDNYSLESRTILYNALKEQYKNVDISKETQLNIENLILDNTYTITTGHQLNLFSGPVYYIYKILSVINLSEKLKLEYPDNNFVPVFWMASEDHDFEEINHFKFQDKKIVWNSNQTGPVGRFNTEGLNNILNIIKTEFGISDKSKYLIDLFKKAYLDHKTLTDATFFLTNELFRKFGIVIVNGDNILLKRNFKKQLKQEILSSTLYKKVTETTQYLSKYFVQVNPREINLFYIDNGIRERIIHENGLFKVLNTNISFNESQILDLIENNPEFLSPNAIFRPVYQETVLPNLAYIGGGGELAYWLELKSSFNEFKVTFPMLIHRDAVLLVTNKIDQKIKKLNVDYHELFLSKNDLISLKTKQYSENLLNFEALKSQLQNQFDLLKITAKKTDISFSNALDAQFKKQTKGLENLEMKLLKAEKKLLKDKVNRVIKLQDELFPNNGLQERKQNFSEFYIQSDGDLIETIKKHINPLNQGFKIIRINNN